VSRPCLFYWWPFCRGFRQCGNLHNHTPFRTTRNHIYVCVCVRLCVYTERASFRLTIFLPPRKVFVCRDATTGSTSREQTKTLYNIICHIILNFFFSCHFLSLPAYTANRQRGRLRRMHIILYKCMWFFYICI